MKLTDLLDQIDRLELEICPGPWVANDLGIGYEITTQQHMPINSGIKDTFPRSDAEFIALARTFTPAAARALRAVMELHQTRVHDEDPTSPFCNICGTVIGQSCESLQAITDVFEDVADGQALDQARAEDDGTRITLDKYLEADDD